MRHLKLYESFVNDLFVNTEKNIKIYGTDSMTTLYLENKISLFEYNNYINEQIDIINESIIEKGKELINQGINWFLQKAASMILSIIQKIKSVAKLGSKIGKSIINVLKGVFKIISKIKQKYPNLYKFIVISLVVIILLIVIFITFKDIFIKLFESDGTPAAEIYDAAFYLLQQMIDVSDMENFELLSDAMTYIKQLKEGGIPSEVSEDVAKTATDAINNIKTIFEKANNNQYGEESQGMMAYIKTMSKIGSNLMDKFTYTKSGG